MLRGRSPRCPRGVADEISVPRNRLFFSAIAANLMVRLFLGLFAQE